MQNSEDSIWQQLLRAIQGRWVGITLGVLAALAAVFLFSLAIRTGEAVCGDTRFLDPNKPNVPYEGPSTKPFGPKC